MFIRFNNDSFNLKSNEISQRWKWLAAAVHQRWMDTKGWMNMWVYWCTCVESVWLKAVERWGANAAALESDVTVTLMHSARREAKRLVFICVSYLESKSIFIRVHCIFKQTRVVYQLLGTPQNSDRFFFFFFWPLSFSSRLSPYLQSQPLSDSQHIPADCPAHVKHPVDIFSMKAVAGPLRICSPQLFMKSLCPQSTRTCSH